MAQRPPSPREPIDIGTGQFEQLLDSRAPAVKQWPNWFRRNFTPASLYAMGGVVATAIVIVTTFVVTSRGDRANNATSNAAIAGKLDALDGKVTAQATEIRLIKCTTDKLAYAEAQRVWVITADWNRRHRMAIPAQPAQPSTEGCPP